MDDHQSQISSVPPPYGSTSHINHATNNTIGHGRRPLSSLWLAAHNRSPSEPSVASPTIVGFSPASTSKLPALPANYVFVQNETGSLRGIWRIDPVLVIPVALMHQSTLDTAELSRLNLCLRTRGPRGIIDAQVWIADSNEEETAGNIGDKKTRISIVREHSSSVSTSKDGRSSEGGQVILRLHTHGPRPLDIDIQNFNGRVTVYLPRQFTGIVHYSARKTHFSPEMLPSVAHFSLDGGDGSSFIGDLGGMQDTEWKGDTCRVKTTTNSHIFFAFSDELEYRPKWWERWMGQ